MGCSSLASKGTCPSDLFRTPQHLWQQLAPRNDEQIGFPKMLGLVLLLGTLRQEIQCAFRGLPEAGTATEPLTQVPEGRHSAVAGGRGGDSATFLRFVSPDAFDAGALLQQAITSNDSD